ncbi:interferon-inducible GTPase 5-like [Mercenaria mercenaria]|uniref:interferon-inducible GTPase 5-like n=1 Tax=Mercenaria mercenaria TaxID=6596 RepID=UPI00234E8FC1|nr:interferon-inducible GTPase 5-like [Mercenaria mercenaria]
MDPKDPNAAKVGSKETTKNPTKYRHPKHDNLVLWDVPGAGTLSFPRENYLEKINANQYDFFIIVVTERFTEIDFWLMDEVQKLKKRYYMVRTKTDIEMASRQHDRAGPFDENEAFEELKTELRSEIGMPRNQDPNFHFFMISNRDTRKYDFEKLELQLVKDVPQEKKSLMVFSLAGMSEKVIEEKANALRSRTWKIALLAGAGAAIPIPFLSTGIDAAVILEEVLFYRSQLALDDDSLGKLAKTVGVSLDTLKNNVGFHMNEDLSISGIGAFLAKHMFSGAGNQIAKYTLPVIGSVISCYTTISTTQFVLEEILDTMEYDARNVLYFVKTLN